MDKTMRKGIIIRLIIWLLFVSPIVLWAAENKEEKATVILATKSYWRAFYTLKTPLIRKGDALEEMKIKYDTPLPPKEWQMLDFDDRTGADRHHRDPEWGIFR